MCGYPTNHFNNHDVPLVCEKNSLVRELRIQQILDRSELVKNKLLLFSLISVLLFSALNVARTKDQCPRCGGSGKITITQTCSTCRGYGVLEPNINLKRTLAWGSEPRAPVATFVAGVFQNEENVGAYGLATAEVKTPTTSYTNSSSRTYFPPHEDITITIIVKEIAFESYWSCIIYLSEVDDIPCSSCDGNGVVSLVIDCPECGGTGFVTEHAEDVTNYLVVGGAIVGVAIVAVVIVRRKKVTEGNLRNLPPSEFQNWVVQRLFGTVSSQRDSYMGIDGYTVEGHPIQVKQSDDIGRNVIDNFAAAMGRSKAKKGIIVAFSFGKDAYKGIVRAKVHYGREIKIVTVKELIESRNRAL
jgi:ribosomal protein S27AE